NIFELNFIKWQLSKKNISTTSPDVKVLSPQTTVLPVKLQKLKKQINNDSQFINLTFQEPKQPEEQRPGECVDNIETLESLITYLDNLPETMIPTTPTTATPVNTPTHRSRGKDINLAKQVYETESTTATTKPKVTRKRKRDSGRPTKDETLIRIDDEDLCALQLSRRELTLPDTKGKCKKSKTILTKLKQDITVTTMKQFQTYELFADTRAKALDTIRENRELLEKINAAEFVLTSLLKKQSEEDNNHNDSN
ncbi:Hypothetical predicted protein, partial [Paramuricea clavata]